MPIAGLGPHGEQAAGPQSLILSLADTEAVRQRGPRVSVVLHTTQSDWAKQLLAGLAAELGKYGAAMLEVVDCKFDRQTQNQALYRLSAERLDAIISIPAADRRFVIGQYKFGPRCTAAYIDNRPDG